MWVIVLLPIIKIVFSSQIFPSESTAGESSKNWKVKNVSKKTVASSVVVVDPLVAKLVQDSFDFRIVSCYS